LARRWVGSGGFVLSIEANPETYELLKRNLQSNGGTGDAVNCALTTSPDREVELFMPAAGDTYSSLRKGGLVTGDLRSFRVPAKTVDAVVEERHLARVDLIKIDVEGADLDVLRSATETIDSFRPGIGIEYSTTTWGAFGATHVELLKYADEHRYDVLKYDVGGRRLVPTEDADWSSIFLNLFLLPRDTKGR
jgi:FkbM family methyltransferase